MHAAISSVLDRPHSQTHRDMGSLIRQSWSMRPWPCESGLAVVWWDEADAAAVVGRRYSARIGRIPVGVRFGPLTRVHAPPRWLPGAYAVRLATRSPVVIRRDGGKNLTHLEPTGMSIESPFTLTRHGTMAPVAGWRNTLHRCACSAARLSGRPALCR